MVADFITYIETLINLFRLSEKLDAAGDTLTRIYSELHDQLKENKGNPLSKKDREHHT